MVKHRVVLYLGAGLLALGAVPRAEAQLFGGYVEPRVIRAGAVELGGFGRWSGFADTVNIKSGFGGGGRLGVFVGKNLSIEGEWSLSQHDVEDAFLKTPNDSLDNVNDQVWTARLLYNAPIGSRTWVLLGGGWMWNNYEQARRVAPRTSGPQALVGLRFGLNDWLHARIEGYGNYAVTGKDEPYAFKSGFNYGAQAGLSVLFLRGRRADTVKVVERIPGPEVRVTDTVYKDRIVEKTVQGTVVIGSVHFAFDKWDLTTDATRILDEIAASLKENPGVGIEVVGNTDQKGTNAYNMGLSEKRANQVADYLKNAGVTADRIKIAFRGEEDLLSKGNDPENRATNRRVLITRVR